MREHASPGRYRHVVLGGGKSARAAEKGIRDRSTLGEYFGFGGTNHRRVMTRSRDTDARPPLVREN